MADAMVQRAQRFINTTYGNGATLGIAKLEENGQTSWTVMYALTRALQYEMGIRALSDAFGPTTMATIAEKYGKLDESNIPSANFCRVIQSALYCKGYDGGEIDGQYNARVKSSVVKLHQNMGVGAIYPEGSLWPKTAKGLFNMDAYTTISGGSDSIRSIQQWLNGKYILRKDYYVIPCDGHNSRDVSKSMLLAIQYELGMADGVANRVFGPGTQAGLKNHTVSVGSTGTWASLFTAGMILNKRPVSFGNFTAAVKSETEKFQSFVKLPVTGLGDFSTWASLLVSYGDQSRKGEACDGVTQITPARVATLKANGIKYIGRYLTNPDPTPSGSTKEKEIQPGELKTIADNGLRCYPIYQTYGRGADDFSYPLGRAAAQAAINAALDHGFKPGTRIYFAVDFDALDYQVTNNVLPHFKGIQDAIVDDGNRFGIGVYGPRNVCTRVGEAGHSTASFVSDMSAGFSGNFGYPLPPDWAFDQIVTRTIGSGDGAINIDQNIASGRDTGQGAFNPPRSVKPDVSLHSTVIEAMKTDVGKYMQSIGYPNDGGVRTYQHWKCFDSVVVMHDALLTSLSNKHNMRKALIQATAYWEMRHIDPVDEAAEVAVITAFNTTGKFIQDPSTGIAQQRAQTLIPAWNHALDKGYATGQPRRNPASDQDKYDIWKKARDNEEFALTSVVMIHRWDIDGKPGGDDSSPALRQPSLSYTDEEVYEVLRRYQGPAEPAFTDAKKRMPLYYLLEKYHSISRNM
ncbi:glycoside hydrolase domain-containing protein [Streptomyces sp. JNUCC 64]